MTLKVWNGATAALGTAADWSPSGAPSAGDVGVIGRGEVLADGLALDGFTLQLAGHTPLLAPTLELTGTTLDSKFRVQVVGGSGGTSPDGTIAVNGTDSNLGQIVAGTASVPASLAVVLGGSSAELVNSGTITANAGSTITVSSGQVVNNGGHVIDNGGTIDLNTQMTGVGAMLVEAGGELMAGQIVGSGQAVYMHGGTLALGSAFNFLATLHDWDSGTTLDLLHTQLTGTTVTGGKLVLHDGALTEAQIPLAGTYVSSDFHIANQANGSALVTTTHIGPWS